MIDKTIARLDEQKKVCITLRLDTRKCFTEHAVEFVRETVKIHIAKALAENSTPFDCFGGIKEDIEPKLGKAGMMLANEIMGEFVKCDDIEELKSMLSEYL